jgi:serine/threonine protein kinase
MLRPRHAFDALPKPFGPYLLTECIGKGGTAAVFKATRLGQGGFEKQVVVKTILPELQSDPLFLQLFREEARLSAQLNHANIAQARDFGVMAGTAYLELEYLVGWNLKQIWDTVAHRGERLPVGIVLSIATEACRGLAYAHAFVDERGEHRPIIHRDISPANVMICRDGAVKLLDFGLATITRGETLAIETFRGKIAYVSPEQVHAKQIDRRADVFAFGVMLHELLTGERLFCGADDAETVRRVVHAQIEAPSKHGVKVPQALDQVVLRCLARDPDDRYQSGNELLEALEDVKGHGAARRELLRYLGTLAPDIYTQSCDACGRAVLYGTECSKCRTIIDPDLPKKLEEAERRLFIVRTPPYGTPRFTRAALIAERLQRGAAQVGAGLAIAGHHVATGARRLAAGSAQLAAAGGRALHLRSRRLIGRAHMFFLLAFGRAFNLFERAGCALSALAARLRTLGPGDELRSVPRAFAAGRRALALLVAFASTAAEIGRAAFTRRL